MKIRSIKHISARLMLIVTVLSIIILSLNPLSAFYDDKKYEVRGAEFHVSFTGDGDAIICETFEVEFIRGQFSRFYKDIYNPDNKLEFIQDLEVLDVKINGNEADEQFTADRNDGRYLFETSSDRYTINWFQHASNETVKYEITYNVENAVKINENNRAVFAFRLIGQNFP
ncbi:MAG: hypothetical protein J6P89_12335, partial [Oscillospiraceae bacterium]|nr:hypothetical protein [Oscillospiraceae bacterium]